MRDGIKLFTSIYLAKNKSEKHPVLLTRTPYSCACMEIISFYRVNARGIDVIIVVKIIHLEGRWICGHPAVKSRLPHRHRLPIGLLVMIFICYGRLCYS